MDFLTNHDVSKQALHHSAYEEGGVKTYDYNLDECAIWLKGELAQGWLKPPCPVAKD